LTAVTAASVELETDAGDADNDNGDGDGTDADDVVLLFTDSATETTRSYNTVKICRLLILHYEGVGVGIRGLFLMGFLA
jgi:hypothetical protein